METINIRLDGPGRLTPTKRLKAALAWAHQFVGKDPRVNRVELRRDTDQQVLVVRFDGTTGWEHLMGLCMVANVQSITYCVDADAPYSWGQNPEWAEEGVDLEDCWGGMDRFSGPFCRIGDQEVRPALRESPGSAP